METGEVSSSEKAVAIVSWLILAWAAMLVLGVAVLVLGHPLGAANPVSINRAVFTSVSTSTLTGFPQSFAQVGDFTPTVRLIFLLQTVSGALLSLVGGGILVGRLVESQHSDRAIATTALVLIGFAALLGAVFIGAGDDLIAAASRGVGALAGSGLSFGAQRPIDDPLLHALFLPLSVVGGAGTIVVLDLLKLALQRTPLTRHTLAVLATLACGYLVGSVLIGGCLGQDLLLTRVLRASALTIAGQGFGFSHERISQLSGVPWVLMALMLTGVGTLGTAGGCGFAWFATLPRSKWTVAVIGVIGTFAVLFASVLALTFTDPQEPADNVLFLSVASVTSTGLAPEPVSMPKVGLLVLSAAMVAGRVLPLLLVGQVLLRQSVPHSLATPVTQPHPIVDNPSKAKRRIGEKGEAR